jgi:hypothetical protein
MRRKEACCNSQSVEIKNFIVVILIIALRRKLSGVVKFSKILSLSLSLSFSRFALAETAMFKTK